MKMYVPAIALGLVASLASCSSSNEPSSTDEDVAAVGSAQLADGGAAGVTIRDVTYRGTGCPAGSAAVSITPDGRQFEMTFSSFVATRGPGVAASEARKDCLLDVQLDVARGYAYSVSGADYQGFAQLDQGVVGQRASTYHFADEPREPAFVDDLKGPLSEEYQFTDTPKGEGKSCERDDDDARIRIRTSVKLEARHAPAAQGLMTVDETDGTVVKETWHLRWRRCR
jgi:hypothetical protein